VGQVTEFLYEGDSNKKYRPSKCIEMVANVNENKKFNSHRENLQPMSQGSKRKFMSRDYD
jgi:hypothetical protein